MIFPGEIFGRHTLTRFKHLFHRPLGHNPPTMRTRPRADINQPVGSADGVFIMFHHNRGVTYVREVAKRLNKPFVVALVQADGRLIQHITDAHQSGTNLRRQPDALQFFDNFSHIRAMLGALNDVGLSYVQLGQSSTTLSGGEAQRIKLASELGKPATGHTVYILDEPTTGLHFADIHNLLNVLNRLTNAGNTVIVIEHNLDVIKCADWIIDMGPEGGAGGGSVVATGTPEDIAAHPHSHTGRFLKSKLAAPSLAEAV